MENDERRACLQRMTGGTLRPGGLTLTTRALELCRMPPEARVLDAGCGNGVTLRHLRERYGVRCCGLDLSMEMLAQRGTRRGGFSRAGKDGRDSLQERRLSRRPVRVCSLPHQRGGGGEGVLQDRGRRRLPHSFRPVSPLSRVGCAAGHGGPWQGLAGRMPDPVWFRYRDLGDRTADLRRLAAELIMSGCSLPPYHVDPGAAPAKAFHDWRGIGYYLLVARRTNDNQCR